MPDPQPRMTSDQEEKMLKALEEIRKILKEMAGNASSPTVYGWIEDVVEEAIGKDTDA